MADSGRNQGLTEIEQFQNHFGEAKQKTNTGRALICLQVQHIAP